MKIFIAIFLLAAIAMGGWYVYENLLFPEPPKPIDEDVPKKLINAQERIIKLESNSEILVSIKNLNKLPAGIFEVIFFSQDKEGARHFLTPLEFSLASGLHLPQKLISPINTYNFGTLGGETKNYHFLILEISSPEAAREGILGWEKNMPKELAKIFSNLGNLEARAELSFRDRVIRNQNARILELGDAQIIHSFYNERLLIIVPSEEVFGAIISRYAVFPPNSN